MKKICLINNTSHTFVAHRMRLYNHLVKLGYEVSVIIPERERIPLDNQLLNKNIHIIKFSRKGVNPFSEFMTVVRLYKKLKELNPDILHNFTIKAVLYGTLVGRLLGLKKIVNTMTGLGYIFTTQTLMTSVLRKVVLTGYKIFFNASNVRVIFQNEDDMQLIQSFNVLNPKICFLIYGSGVDTDFFTPEARKSINLKPIIICIARLLHEKGLSELIAALKILNSKQLAFECLLIGYKDGNYGSFTDDEMKDWSDIPQLTLLGFQKDIRSYLDKADIFCLPSYREGLPMANIEAAAMKLPIVTTDAPGCNKTVIDGLNGFMVPIKDVNALAEKLAMLITSKDLRRQMGEESRKLAVKNFSSIVISNQILELYKS